MVKTHAFYEKDPETGDWMVYCRAEKGRFNTNVWKQGKVTPQTCPCCGGGMKDEYTTRSDAEIRELNEERYGHAAVTGSDQTLDRWSA